jgi:hypothetical protein
VNDYAMYDGYDSYNDSGSGGVRSDEDSGQGYSEEEQLVEKKDKPVIKSGSNVYFYPSGREGMGEYYLKFYITIALFCLLSELTTY